MAASVLCACLHASYCTVTLRRWQRGDSDVSMCMQVTLNSAKAYLSHESPTAHVSVLESMQEMLLREEMAEEMQTGEHHHYPRRACPTSLMQLVSFE